MPCLYTESVQLLPWQVRSPDLSPIENIWLWVSERLGRHRSLATTIEEVWYRLEAAWNELPVSVIQVQFDSMLNRVQAAAVCTNFTPCISPILPTNLIMFSSNYAVCVQ